MIDGSKKRNNLLSFEFQSSRVIERRSKKNKIALYFVHDYLTAPDSARLPVFSTTTIAFCEDSDTLNSAARSWNTPALKEKDTYSRNYLYHGVYSLLGAVFNWVSKVIAELPWFFFTMLYDWFKKTRVTFFTNQMQNKETNRDLVTRVFPLLVPVTYICFEFSLVHCVGFVCCDWPF